MRQDKITAIHSFPVWLPQTQTWMYNQVKYLPESVEVHVVCERTENLNQFAVPNLHSLRDVSKLQYVWEKSLRNLKVRYIANFLTSVARKLNANIIHSHFGHIGWSNLEGIKQTRIKHVVTFYGADVNRLPTQDHRWLHRYKELFERADLFLCEGPHMANQLNRLGCSSDKVRVHHLGADMQRIPYSPRQWQGDEPLRVLIAASFREKKGIPYALKALAKLQNFLFIEITIIGDAGADPSSRTEKQRILKTIADYGLQTRVRLLGFQPYSVFFEEAYKHHIFISPSVTASDGDTEGGAPVSIIELMATGMPVVSTLHCDIPEVVQYGMDDWLVEERSVDGLIKRLEWLANNGDKWNKLLDIGRRHVEREFDAVQQGKSLEQVYLKLLNC